MYLWKKWWGTCLKGRIEWGNVFMENVVETLQPVGSEEKSLRIQCPDKMEEGF